MSDDKIRVREDQEKCSSCKMRKFDPPKPKCQEVDFHWLMDGKRWVYKSAEGYRQEDTTSTRRTAFDGLLAPTDDEESSVGDPNSYARVKQTSGEAITFSEVMKEAMKNGSSGTITLPAGTFSVPTGMRVVGPDPNAKPAVTRVEADGTYTVTISTN